MTNETQVRTLREEICCPVQNKSVKLAQPVTLRVVSVFVAAVMIILCIELHVCRSRDVRAHPEASSVVRPVHPVKTKDVSPVAPVTLIVVIEEHPDRSATISGFELSSPVSVFKLAHPDALKLVIEQS